MEVCDVRPGREALYRAARRHSRVWMYDKGTWDGRGIQRGADEYGRWTVVVRLPGHRAVVWACWTCRCDEAHEARASTARFAWDEPGTSPEYLRFLLAACEEELLSRPARAGHAGDPPGSTG